MANKLTVHGDKAILEAFQRVGLKEARKVIRTATRSAGRPMLASAKREAPKGETKKLSGGITLRATRRSRVYVGVKVALPTRAKLGQVGPRLSYYPASVHYGFKHRGGKKVQANRFLDRAFDQNVRQAAQGIQRSLTQFAERMR